MLDLPKYMNDVLHFSIQDNGIYSSIPQLIKLIMALVTGALNDWLIAKNYLTITGGRKIFVAFGECPLHDYRATDACPIKFTAHLWSGGSITCAPKKLCECVAVLSVFVYYVFARAAAVHFKSNVKFCTCTF